MVFLYGNAFSCFGQIVSLAVLYNKTFSYDSIIYLHSIQYTLATCSYLALELWLIQMRN